MCQTAHGTAGAKVLNEMMSSPLERAAIDWNNATENLFHPLPRALYGSRSRLNSTKPAVPAILRASALVRLHAQLT